MKMDCVTLYNGLQLPIIGYGTFPQKDTLAHNVPYAYNVGYRMLDTSDNYLNEEYVGAGLASIENTDITVITKFSQPLRTNELENCFNESFCKLKRKGEQDVYLMHWPFPYLWKTEWRKMEDLYLQGKCAAIGVCNFDIGYLKELLRVCRVKPMINQFEHHPLFQQKELVEMCKQENIQVMSYSPLARMDEQLNANSVLTRIAEKYGKTVNQVVLRWNIDTNCIPIPASSSEKHIKENFDIFDFKLTQEDIEEINQLDCGKRIRFNPRTRFDKYTQRKFFIESLRMESPITAKVINKVGKLCRILK